MVVFVVTIILVIILAGVTVRMVIGDNGIIKKSKETVDEFGRFVGQQQAYIDGKDEELKTGIDPITTENLKKFITEWTVEAGDEITLPLVNDAAYSYNFDVDYGDGTVVHVSSATDENRKHKYKESRTYTVKISGTCECWSFNDIADSKLKITKLNQWGEVGVKIINFNQCSNLGGTIPIPTPNSLKYSNNLSLLFNECSNLTGEIPNNLLYNCNNTGKFYRLFYGCSGLTGSIPEDLFKDCINATNLGAIFFHCTGLTGEIPEDLFKNCSRVSNFQSTFYNCTGLIGEIPEDLFKNCINVEIFNYTFYNCTGLIGNVPDLWNIEKYPNVTEHTQCFRSMSSTNITNYSSIPDGWK